MNEAGSLIDGSSETALPLTALLLAGGCASRLGGNKADRLVAGVRLLDHAAALAATVSDDVILLAGPRDYRVDSARRVADWPDVGGPLAGLGAGLEAARHDWCLLLPCDMPFLDERVVGALCDRLRSELQAGSRPDAVISVSNRSGEGARRQPFPGLYHRHAVRDVRVTVTTGKPSLMRLLDRLRVAEVTASAEDSRALLDVDTPGELAAARGDIER